MVETRKLAAILAADVVGHSRRAGSDADRTLARLRALRREWGRSLCGDVRSNSSKQWSDA